VLAREGDADGATGRRSCVCVPGRSRRSGCSTMASDGFFGSGVVHREGSGSADGLDAVRVRRPSPWEPLRMAGVFPASTRGVYPTTGSGAP